MAEYRPPRLVSGERETLQALYQFQRESLIRKVADLDDEQARRHFVASETTLVWLVDHMTHVEGRWVLHRFAGMADPAQGTSPSLSIGDAVALYRAMWDRVDAVIAQSDLDAVCALVGDEAPVNLRWILMHLLEELARHAGHADIIRELIDESTGR